MRKNGGATDINDNLNDIKNVTATVVEGAAAAAVIIANIRWVPGTGTPVLQGGTRPRGSVARGREGGRQEGRRRCQERSTPKWVSWGTGELRKVAGCCTCKKGYL